jgi:cell fate regulator YaaT (PSP1 superfamily)
MGCASCSVTKNGVPQGCGDKGHCSSGSCNKKNTFDWLSTMDLNDPLAYTLVEVSFKKGNRKAFYFNPEYTEAITGDLVVVESTNGYDVGRVCLSGDLVRLQMKKKNIDEESILYKVVRIANHRDIEKLDEARALEAKAMVQARKITRTLDVEMKIGDVEYQGDKRKATFYYTAEGRIDFRELVRVFAKEFRVKIEMKQIGARQESSIIGGIGTCGRELCCSTWKSNFETVNTTAARYQNLAINQTKLTGQCGRLKCCLNYELDAYIDALGDFPEKADVLKLEGGYANLIKTDIFKGLMYYSIQKENFKGPLVPISKERVKKILAMNKAGIKISDFDEIEDDSPKKIIAVEDIELEYADVTGQIELPDIKRRKKGRNQKRSGQRKPTDRRPSQNKGADKNPRSSTSKPAGKQEGSKPPTDRPKRFNKGNQRNKPKGDGGPNPNKGPRNRNEADRRTGGDKHNRSKNNPKDSDSNKPNNN